MCKRNMDKIGNRFEQSSGTQAYTLLSQGGKQREVHITSNFNIDNASFNAAIGRGRVNF